MSPDVAPTGATGPAGEGASTAGPVVALRDVGMSFGRHRVLHGIDLDIAGGEVLALLGANGAGKSTLIKVLAGAHPGHTGAVEVDGVVADLSTPVRARELGVATVHQRVHEGIVPGLSVAENLVLDDLARPPAAPGARGGRVGRVVRGALLDRRGVQRSARAALDVLELDWSDALLRRDVADLGISDAQLLVLARALVHRPRLLVLDEPTSALSSAEAERLFAVVRRQRDAGLAVLYVSHRLGEIDAVAERAVVLREGRITDDSRAPFAWRRVLPAMLGEHAAALDGSGDRDVSPGADVALRLRGVRLLPESAPLDLDVRAGQVTGVVGLIGAGKSELAHGLFGSAPWAAGTAELDGAPLAPRRPGDAVRAGVHLVPEDRASQAVLPGWSVARTLSLPFLRQVSRTGPAGAVGVLDERAERAAARGVVQRLGVVTRDEQTDVGELSGGNQQKVVVGRWLVDGARVLVLDEPFRGVDLGARKDIGDAARAVALGAPDTTGAPDATAGSGATGAAPGGRPAVVLLLSADVDEVLEVADRVVVLVDGAVSLDEPVVPSDTGQRARVVSAFSQHAHHPDPPEDPR